MRVLLLFIAMSIAASADEVELSGGEIIRDCKVTEEGNTLKITKGGVTRTVLKADVKSWQKKPTLDDTFKEKLAAIKADDAPALAKLAAWCVENRLRTQGDETYRKVIAIESDHAEARAALGYTKIGDKWLTADEIKTAQGLVRHNGRWVTPEERDLDIAIETQKVLEKKTLIEIRSLAEKTGLSDPAKRAEAIAGLEKFDDSLKPKVFVAFVSDGSKHTRLFIATELGRLKTEVKESGTETEVKAVRGLARRAIWDEVDAIRDAAFKSLLAINHPDTATALMIFLGEEARLARLRTAGRLESFKDLRPLPQLIELLDDCREMIKMIDANKDRIAKFIQGQMITKDGRIIPMPRKFKFLPSVFDERTREDLVEEKTYYLSALRTITGQDLTDDPEKWRAWYEANRKK